MKSCIPIVLAGLFATACATPTREAPMIARPDNVVVHVSPDALRPKVDPVVVSCAPSSHVDPSPIGNEELQAALARLPPTEQRIEITKVFAAPTVDGRVRVQGRGGGFVNGGSPWHTNGTNFDAQLEVALPDVVAPSCEEAVKTALRSGKSLDVTGVGLFRAGSTGASSFGLFMLDRVTSCTVHG